MSYSPGDILLNKYRIEALVGRGAFAEVYRAMHLKLSTHRALKILRKDAPGLGSSEFVSFHERFQFEARLGARLNHPNIIQVHDFEQDGDTLVLVMEYAAGGSLVDRLDPLYQSAGFMPLEQVIPIAIDIAQGLSALHALDSVHRDLKPSNILFDAQGHAKVSDLGLAQIRGGPSQRSKLSRADAHPGTPGYMSPEQYQVTNYLKSSSDIYSLGCVVFEMLTNRLYSGQRPGARPRQFRSETPVWLDELVVRMLAQTPEERPWDGLEAARLLQQDWENLQREAARLTAEKQAREKAIAEKEAEDLRISAAIALKEQRRKEAEQKARAEAEEKARRQAQVKAQRLLEQRQAQAALAVGMFESAYKRNNWTRAKQAVEKIARLGESSQAQGLRQRLEQAQQADQERKQRTRQRRKAALPGWLPRGKWLFVTLLAAVLVIVMISQYQPMLARFASIKPPPSTVGPSLTHSPAAISPSLPPSKTATLPFTSTHTPTLSPTPNFPSALVSFFKSTVVTPNPEAIFSPLTFATALDRNYSAVDPGETFTNPVPHLYALFSYDRMRPNFQWTAVWYRDGELIHFETKPWDGPAGGMGYSDWLPEPGEPLPGRYEVQIFSGLEFKVSGFFTITGDLPNPLPTLTPMRSATPTPTSSPTLSPTPTLQPTWTRIPFYPTSTPTPTRKHSPGPTNTPAN